MDRRPRRNPTKQKTPMRALDPLARERRRAGVDETKEFGEGRFAVLGEPVAFVQRLNPHVVVGRFARGHFGIVGHYRQAHVEAGPFAALGEARAAWLGMRRELEAFRQARIASRRDGTAWPPPGAGGTGWTSQAGYTARCGGCARRAAQRTERSGIGADGGAEAAPGPATAGSVPVRRRQGVAAAEPAG